MQGKSDVDLSLYNPQTDEPFALNGRYRLDAIAGHGGMGKVFQGTDLVLNRPVVVKILLSEYVQEKTFVERFTREAKILSQISHPHLLVIYDYGIYAHKTPYIVTEFVEGRTLAEIIASEGRMQVKRAVSIVSQVLDALAATHAHGVIHRDLKAENILIGGTGETEWVKVIDFGLAYQMTHRPVSEHATRITGSGLFVGTLAYMPPEQFMNENLDGRTDIYSVGILLWEMLVGHVPFQAPSLERYYAKHSSEPVPAFSTIQPPLPGPAMALEPVIGKALAKRAKDRWKDVTEFKVALRKAQEKAIRDAVPYEAYNIKTERIPTDRIPYPTTDRLRHYEVQMAIREAKGKTAFKLVAREDGKPVQLSAKAKVLRAWRQLAETFTLILSGIVYLIVIGVVSFIVYVGYPKVRGILYPPPHVSLGMLGMGFDGTMATANLVGDAEFCTKLGKVTIETTLVDVDHKLFLVQTPPDFLTRTSDGTYADVVEMSIRSQTQPLSHTVYLPYEAFLKGDASKPFRFRVRIIDSAGNILNTLYSSPLRSSQPPASSPVPSEPAASAAPPPPSPVPAQP